MILRGFPLILPIALLVILLSTTSVRADGITLYLKDGSTVRGKITDRSVEKIRLLTSSGPVEVGTDNLMEISRRQLRLPVRETLEGSSSDVEILILQMEKLLAENEALKKEIAALRKGEVPAVAETAQTVP